MTVPCGQRTKLQLKIVSGVCYTDHKRGKTFDWNQHKKVLLKAGGRGKLHLDPANPFAYVLVVQAFRSGEPVSAELVLGPFEFFNNDTSAVRCTPRATRRMLHATRHAPHAACGTSAPRYPLTPPPPCTGESRL